MSASKRIAIAVTISWISRAIGILSGLLLMPILFRFMGKEELGLWFLLGNSQAFLGLLGMGIAPTLTRRIAFAKGKSGSNPDAELTEESKQDIGDWVVTGKIILQWLAVIIFFVAWISGYGLIRELKLEEVSPQTVFWAWTLMCLGYAINVWVAYLGCWLQGIGYVGWDSLIATILAVVTIGANIVAVLMGGGLIALATISVVSGLANRFVFIRFLRWRQPQLFIFQGQWRDEYAKSIIKPCFLYWLTSLGSFLILRTDAYFISILKGVDNLPKYQAAYSLIATPYSLAISFAASSSVFLSQAWQARDLKFIRHLTFRNAQIGLSLMAVSVGFIMSTGKSLVNIWLGNENFIGYGVISIFCIMLTLEAQNVIFVYSGRATEDEVYAPWTLSAGILNIIFTWLLIKPFGLLGVAMGTMFAQMLTNNWYAVYRPVKRLKLDFLSYLNDIISWWLILLISSYSLTKLSQAFLKNLQSNSDLHIIIISVLINGILLLLFFWHKILTSHQKNKLISKVKMLSRFD
ncbi:lipopolysaccharide biosynthesis protein [Picosynechococcus sp. PCC 8807]|uniref:lipopolysaccharide biosynthesis protein n=1 Tax=Picosynechococcus sp. PCC 8807 TaxID=195248 RepID=UPI000810E50A|nr:teichoic acid transporter [Picosynechococcus sp. PCC 8807]ANV90503.1 teichoic acid transporter [Picosynechococcus sp. PCC 8807]